MAGTRADGKEYCAQCLPTGARPLITCTRCNQVGHAYSKKLCEECGWDYRFELLMARSTSALQTAWGREFFAAYHRDSRSMHSHGAWHRSIRKDIAFFIELEKHFQSTDELNGVLLVRKLGWPLLLCHQRVVSYLAHIGLVDISDPDFVFEKGITAIRSILPREPGWVTDVLRRYFDHLIERRSHVIDRRKRRRTPTKLRSMRSILAASRSFLEHARDIQGVQSVQGLTQTILDAYLAQSTGELALASFVPYLNRQEKLFRRLKMPEYRKKNFPFHLIMPEQERVRALRFLLGAQSKSEVRWALIGLLTLVYGQHAHLVCAMHLDRVRASAEGYEIQFAKHWILLDPQTDRIMKHWLSMRREFSNFELTDESVYLFPGRQATHHVSPTSIAKCLPYMTRKLRATGIAALVKSGINQPRVLIDGFGISRPSALSYCEHLAGHLGARARIVVSKYD